MQLTSSLVQMWLSVTGYHDMASYDGTNLMYVATLALGLRPKQRGCKGAGQA